ncbi:LOW QUALITY PROTEIN: disintegrin and metalloproteinase domain-containing protein 25-like [Mastomys coucha]|uniref:LOW QUALITY PROTEIN: disintegrin and metalloproteinase domain-containing protein 25-like n=1 Tax=Mastomys coucha TaxID=35658 RepID=UPI001261E158|nr:LOW QUALITY PROTEIN: disintegrin and metalloproteinase domain-containing protein 25-like [Mastomys coucha]
MQNAARRQTIKSQGILQINGTVYEIKPKSLSSTFEHSVHKIDSEETELLPMRCALTEEEIQQMKLQKNEKPTLMQSHDEGWWTHKCFLDLALVVDRERIRYHNNNTSHVLVEIFTIINIINEIYFALDIEVLLIGVEMWNEGNHVPVDRMEILLEEFCVWKTISLNIRIPNDIAHIFVNRYFGNLLGLAYVGSVCVPSHNCGVDRLLGRNLWFFGHIIAHEMGHNLGMRHDSSSCTCGSKNCLMSPTYNANPEFSNCSYAAFWTTFATTNCLRKEKKSIGIFGTQFCGNGVVDDGEQCDCGDWHMCRADQCCNPSCTLKAGAACAFGLCCLHCQILPAGTLCRQEVNECDLPEWCNGQSHKCPNDVYLLDGSPCKDGGYCYEKRCNNRDEQCKQIFGKEARSAAHSCYRELNTQGDRFGNCGMIRNAYLRCHDSDILCGRVQCENVRGIPYLREHSTVLWTHLNGVTCWGTDYHFGMTIPDIGFVKDGTDCGPEHVCINKKCVNKSMWLDQCSPKTCTLKGVCNNLHHCHCNHGWDPPRCLESGFGGSVDSGPPPGEKEEPPQHMSLEVTTLILFVTFIFVMIPWVLNRYATASKIEEPTVSTSEEEEGRDVASNESEQQQVEI